MTSIWKRQWVFVTAILSLTLGMLTFASLPATVAQEGLESLSGAPVDIHEGGCDDFLTEPAYDGGDVEVQSLNELRDSDGFVGSGLTEVGNTLGVDVNGDGDLDDTETVGGVDDDIQVAVTEADIEDGLDTEQPWVVALHAGADTYDTIYACGSISEAAEDDDGNLIAYMHPVGDSNLFGYAVINGDRNNVSTYLFQPGSAPQEAPAGAGTDDATPEVAEGFPVDIHEGTCTNWTLEPAYDGGLMEVTNVAAEGEQDVGDTEAQIPENAAELGDVYHVDNEADFTGEDLLSENSYVVAVHQSEDEYNSLVACGPILDIPENDNLVVPLMPVESDWTGVALIPQEGDGAISAFLWKCEPLEQQQIPTPPPSPEPTPSPTPEPTVVIEETEVVTETEVVEVTEVVTETEVVEVTEVVTETEVVTAPTATAMAGGGGEAQLVELGDESPGDFSAQAGQTITMNNTSDAERVFRVSDLGIEETLPAGEETDVTLPDDAEAGDYTYEIVEGEETVFEGTLTVE